MTDNNNRTVTQILTDLTSDLNETIFKQKEIFNTKGKMKFKKKYKYWKDPTHILYESLFGQQDYLILGIENIKIVRRNINSMGETEQTLDRICMYVTFPFNNITDNNMIMTTLRDWMKWTENRKEKILGKFYCIINLTDNLYERLMSKRNEKALSLCFLTNKCWAWVVFKVKNFINILRWLLQTVSRPNGGLFILKILENFFSSVRLFKINEYFIWKNFIVKTGMFSWSVWHKQFECIMGQKKGGKISQTIFSQIVQINGRAHKTFLMKNFLTNKHFFGDRFSFLLNLSEIFQNIFATNEKFQYVFWRCNFLIVERPKYKNKESKEKVILEYEAHVLQKRDQRMNEIFFFERAYSMICLINDNKKQEFHK